VIADHRLGKVAAAEAAQLRLELRVRARHGEHVLAGQQIDGDRRQPLRRVRHRDGAMTQQLGLGDDAVVAASG
jgi:hypothetical protein